MSFAHRRTLGHTRGRRLAAAAAALGLALAAAPALSAAAPLLVEQRPTNSAPAAAPAATSVDPALTVGLERAASAPAIVRFGAVDPARVVAAIEETGGTVGDRLAIIDGLAATVTAGTVAALVDLGVHSVSHDGPVTLAHGSVDETVTPHAQVARSVNAARVHRSGVDGAGVGIAIIDTGVADVGDLAGRVRGGVDLTAESDGVDRFGHGTFVAGVAAGRTYGIAPGAHVVPVKIAGANGAADVSQVLAALQWVASFGPRHGIGVVNLSLGTDSTQHWSIDPLNYAVERVWDAGIVVVVSASNRGPGAGTVTKPADDPWVIAVGALDGQSTAKTADDVMAAYSGRGPTVSGGLAKPDIVTVGSHLLGTRAPGSTIDTAHPEARYGDGHLQGSGTSFASAIVTGAVALIRDAHPDWSPNQVKGALLQAAARGPVGDPNVDGAGAMDVLAAVQLTAPVPANQGLSRSSGTGSLGASRGTVEIAVTDTFDQVVETVTCVEKLTSGGLLGGIIKTLVCTVEETVQTTSVLLTVLDSTTDLTAQNKLFDARDYRQDPWTEASWSGAQWYGAQWYGAQWYGAQWYGAQWYGAQWYGAQWYSESYG